MNEFGSVTRRALEVEVELRRTRENLFQSDAAFEQRNVSAEARMDPVAEREDSVRAAVDVESIRRLELRLVPIRRGVKKNHRLTGFDSLASNLDRVHGHTTQELGRHIQT